METCPLCDPEQEQVLWRDARCRVILTPQPAYPAFCRVVWRDHVAEMSELSPADRAHLMSIVWAVEDALRALLQPDKINLASLGNMVPHLHWHVIPRFRDDAHFPDAVWAVPRRTGVEHQLDALELRRGLAQRLGASPT